MQERKNIGLYGPHNMWYVSRRCYNSLPSVPSVPKNAENNYNFYTLTYDGDIPCSSIKHEILGNGTPTEFLNNNRDEYEYLVAVRILSTMMHPNKPDIIRTFNSIDNNVEIISHTHVKIKNIIRSISDLSIEERKRIWSVIYPNVYDIVGDESLKIQPSDYIFAISSCMTPLIKNGGIMPHEERLQATIEQLQSIRKICPQATIFLLESSSLNFDDIERLYDFVDYIFLFEKNEINKELAAKNKSLGESYLIHSLLRRLPPYKLFIKFSGRYKLVNKFKLENLSTQLPTFRITPKEITWSNKGVCESILYSVPYNFNQQLLSLLWDIINGKLYIDIEHMLYLYFCPNNDISRVFDIKELYVVGMMAGHPGVYNRV